MQRGLLIWWWRWAVEVMETLWNGPTCCLPAYDLKFSKHISRIISLFRSPPPSSIVTILTTNSELSHSKLSTGSTCYLKRQWLRHIAWFSILKKTWTSNHIPRATLTGPKIVLLIVYWCASSANTICSTGGLCFYGSACLLTRQQIWPHTVMLDRHMCQPLSNET